MFSDPVYTLRRHKHDSASWAYDSYNASVIDGTFETPHVAVLEIKNLGNFNVRLNFKDPIAMMLFAELKDPVTQKMQTQYGAGQNKVTAPNLRFRTGYDR